MKGELSFSNLVDTSPQPWEDFDLRDLITYSISIVYMDLSVTFGRGFLKACDKK